MIGCIGKPRQLTDYSWRINFSPTTLLLHPQRLEHRVLRIRVEPRLKLREQLARYRRDVAHARHGQQQTFCSRFRSDLKRVVCQISIVAKPVCSAGIGLLAGARFPP